jgi:hypothetical protein
MRYVFSALVLSAMLSAPAFAGETQTADARDGARVVYVCDSSTMTRRAFTREFGSNEFVTAEAVAAARGQAWAAPKCITPTEARRLKQLTNARQEVASLR